MRGNSVTQRRVELRLSVKICVLLSIGIPVIAAYCYFYEAGWMGHLPVINYPLRPYALPLLATGFLFLILGIVFYKFSGEGK